MTTEQQELLRIEEVDAWFEYLHSTRDLSGSDYAEAEPWAWARLRQRRDALRRRARRLGVERRERAAA